MSHFTRTIRSLDYPDALLEAAALDGNVELIRALLPYFKPHSRHNAIHHAAEYGHLEALLELLDDPRDDPLDGDMIRVGAGGGGYMDVIVPRTDHRYSDALRVAAAHGHLDMVEALLEKGDPTYSDHAAYLEAAANGHANIVEMLLMDDRVDPTFDEHYAMTIAAQRGHIDVVKVLLADGRVEVTDQAKERALRGGHEEILALLEA